MQNEYFGTVSEVIHRWNGVVEKYIGDAVVAVFGAPRSDEYDAYRAVLAGLQIQEALSGHRFANGLRIRARVGIATGEAVVDLAAAQDGSQALVSGDVVNTASRVQSYATAGTVVVTAATRRGTAPLVRYQDLPRITVAGRAVPLEIWQAEGPIQRRGVAGPAPDDAPLVGRHTELATVAERLRRVAAERVPDLVSVVGQAGTGKSRLLRELARHAHAGHLPALWRVGHCSPCGGGRYEALTEIMRIHLGIGDSDDPVAVRRRLVATVGALFSPAELPGALDALAQLLGLPGAPAPAAEIAELVWQRILLAAAVRQPLVFVVEDLHRADPAMTRFVWDLFAAATAAPEPTALAVIVTYRPDPTGTVGADFPDHGRTVGETPDHGRTVVLRALGIPDTSVLLRHLLDRAGHPAALVGRLLPLAGGNPLYAEEYVRIVAAGDTRLPAPELVRAIVSARIDQLDGRDRAAVQGAAVLGDAVWPDALAAVLGVVPAHAEAALRRLEGGGLLVQQAHSTIAGQLEYAFVEAAVREVAYGRLPRAVRADHHRRAAEWLDATADAGQSGVDTERTRHWAVAVELARVLGWNARPYLIAAYRTSPVPERRTSASTARRMLTVSGCRVARNGVVDRACDRSVEGRAALAPDGRYCRSGGGRRRPGHPRGVTGARGRSP